MQDLNIKFQNVDTAKISDLLSQNNDIVSKINNTILHLPAFNILNNEELLIQTIRTATNFINSKNHFFVFGTGGSSLGSRALINILLGKEKNIVSFCDNIDPLNFKNSLEKFKLEDLGYVIISKSGSTPETLSQFGCLIELFNQKNQLDLLFKNCLIITENKPNSLRHIGNQYQCKIIDHEMDIGGRYSVFSNVGIVPAIIAGIDVKKFHNGAKYLLDKVKNGSFNEHLKLAKLFSSKTCFKKINNTVLMTYADSLFYFGKWYLQLWAESIGKKNVGITPIHAIGTTDQHSQLQLYLDGPKDKFFTFITTNHSSVGLTINKSVLEDHNLQYLAGKSMGDLMQAEQQATIDTFRKNRFAYREIYLPIINEFLLGQLMLLSMIETVATCFFFDVNPFDQPAVEQGKNLTKQYLI